MNAKGVMYENYLKDFLKVDSLHLSVTHPTYKTLDIFMSYSRKLNVCLHIRESMIPKMKESLFHLLRNIVVTCDKINFFILFATHTLDFCLTFRYYSHFTTFLKSRARDGFLGSLYELNKLCIYVTVSILAELGTSKTNMRELPATILRIQEISIFSHFYFIDDSCLVQGMDISNCFN